MNYVVFDIETGYAPDGAIQKAVESWKPPENVKDPEKIEVRRKAFADEAKQKSALTDAAPVKSIAMKANDGNGVCIHCIGSEPSPVHGWNVVAIKSERGMLVAAAKWLSGLCDDDTILAGHNITGFDIPKLRNRFIKNGIALPRPLRTKLFQHDKIQPVYDTMSQARYFSNELSNERFIGFGRLADSLGVPHHKGEISGADIPAIIENGDVKTVVKYNIDDVNREEEVFLKMTGLSLGTAA